MMASGIAATARNIGSISGENFKRRTTANNTRLRTPGRLSFDISGPYPRSRRGNTCTYITYFMDNFSNFEEAIPMVNQEAITITEALVENAIVRYGTPIQLLTDQRRNVGGTIFREICKLLQID